MLSFPQAAKVGCCFSSLRKAYKLVTCVQLLWKLDTGM